MRRQAASQCSAPSASRSFTFRKPAHFGAREDVRQTGVVLSNADIERFLNDGVLPLRRAFPRSIADACCGVLWNELAMRGCDRNVPATWREPVVRLNCPGGGPFAQAGASAILWDAYDSLLGPGRWRRWEGVGGTVPVRFPSERDPGDAGWHVDGSYGTDNDFWVNVSSRDRGLLVLFLFTDVDEADAPTRILVGSHLDVPAVLAPAGGKGMPFGDVASKLPPSTFEREVMRATGGAGDVFICHPFLVHAASWPHRGTRARMIAQPAVAGLEPFALSGTGTVYPVERAILRGLGV